MEAQFKQIQGYKLNAVADIPDERDLIYRPSLAPVPDELLPDFVYTKVLDQGSEGACTGFGLAGVLNYLDQQRQRQVEAKPRGPVSARMLYEMARKFDEWPGDNYSGSSCRGAIKGWQNMGVCTEDLWPYHAQHPGELTYQRAQQAKSNRPGAYYRLEAKIADYHAALNETGAIYVSAMVHAGWDEPDPDTGIITPYPDIEGGHAFAIVGYNAQGFWIQNSWGPRWGKQGFSLWRYQDWQCNVTDAWVVRFGVPLEDYETQNDISNGALTALSHRVRRSDIVGHFTHIDDGNFHSNGAYFSSLADVQQVAAFLQQQNDYDHLLIYAHGGLNSPTDSANRIAALKPIFKQNRIYPFHFMYDTGILEEIKDVVLRKNTHTSTIGGFAERWDHFIEGLVRVPGRALWREMKRGAILPFAPLGAGCLVLTELLNALPTTMRLHLAGHSTGAILLAHMLRFMQQQLSHRRVNSCSLFAPACSLELFQSHYRTLLKTVNPQFGIDEMAVYNLTDRMEKNDTVGGIYRKSLLYLVSRAFEEQAQTPLLGLEKYSVSQHSKEIEFIYSEGKRGSEPASRSESHGGFDNDPASMNALLCRILSVSQLPKTHFTQKNLDY
jgi:hypothetical protein